jgi:hypothetical protein
VSVQYVGMMVSSGVLLYVIVLVFCSNPVRSYEAYHGWYIFLIVAVIDVPSRTIDFTVSGFTTQLLYCPQVDHTYYHLENYCCDCSSSVIFLFPDWVYHRGVFRQDKKKRDLNKCK